MHKILDTCDCSLQLFMVKWNPIQSPGKVKMRLRRNPHHKICQLEELKTAEVQHHETNYMIQKPHPTLNLYKMRRERKPRWLQNASTLLIGERDLLALSSTRRCSRTKETKSTLAVSISDPLTHPVSGSSSSSRAKR